MHARSTVPLPRPESCARSWAGPSVTLSVRGLAMSQRHHAWLGCCRLPAGFTRSQERGLKGIHPSFTACMHPRWNALPKARRTSSTSLASRSASSPPAKRALCWQPSHCLAIHTTDTPCGPVSNRPHADWRCAPRGPCRPGIQGTWLQHRDLQGVDLGNQTRCDAGYRAQAQAA